MTEVLKIEEIKARFSPDWVLIGDLEIDEDLTTVRAGRVIFHDPDRDTVFRKARDYPDGQYAYFFMGDFPTDMEFVL